VAVLFALSAGCASRGSIYDERDHIPSQELAGVSREVLPAGVHLRSVDARGLDVTKRAEGWVPHLYDDAVMYCTIGYGHLIDKSPCEEVAEAKLGDFARGLTEPQGEALLVIDMSTAQYTVMKSVGVTLSDGQFAALSDFVFNVGSLNFRASTLLQVVNARQNDRIAGQFRRWVFAKGKPWPGLEERREAEINLFFDGQPQRKAVPRPEEELTPIDIETGEHYIRKAFD
jgi:lysozyme